MLERQPSTYRCHPITELCIEYGFVYPDDKVKADTWFKPFVEKYPDQVLKDTFRYTIDVMQKNEKQISAPWGYFKKVFAGEIERFHKEYKVNQLKEEIMPKVAIPAPTIEQPTSQATTATLDPQRAYKEFAELLGHDVFMSCVERGGTENMLTYTIEDFKMSERIMRGEISNAECEVWVTKMRSLGFGSAFDRFYTA